MCSCLGAGIYDGGRPPHFQVPLHPVKTKGDAGGGKGIECIIQKILNLLDQSWSSWPETFIKEGGQENHHLDKNY